MASESGSVCSDHADYTGTSHDRTLAENFDFRAVGPLGPRGDISNTCRFSSAASFQSAFEEGSSPQLTIPERKIGAYAVKIETST